MKVDFYFWAQLREFDRDLLQLTRFKIKGSREPEIDYGDVVFRTLAFIIIGRSVRLAELEFNFEDNVLALAVSFLECLRGASTDQE